MNFSNVGKVGLSNRIMKPLMAPIHAVAKFAKIVAIPLFVATSPAILNQACTGGSITLDESENSAFTKELLSGIPLGTFNANITTEEASTQIVELNIPISLIKGWGQGLEDMQLSVELTTDFKDFPVSLLSWEILAGEQVFSSPADFDPIELASNPDAVVDLPYDLNMDGVMEKDTTLILKLEAQTIPGAVKGKDYTIPVKATLFGSEGE